MHSIYSVAEMTNDTIIIQMSLNLNIKCEMCVSETESKKFN